MELYKVKNIVKFYIYNQGRILGCARSSMELGRRKVWTSKKNYCSL